MGLARVFVAAAVLVPLASFAQAPPPTPTPAPRFNSGSALDGLRNRAWAQLEEATDAYEQCDPERFERALNELERIRREAKAAAATATGAAEFSRVTPAEANGLADTLDDMIRVRSFLLSGLKHQCKERHSPGRIGTLLGPRRPTGTTPAQPPTTPAQPTGGQQPAGGQGQATEPPDSIMDDIEEEERADAQRCKAERDRQRAQGSSGTQQQQQPPPQPTTATPPPPTPSPTGAGINAADEKAISAALQRADQIEQAVHDLETDNWASQELRARIATDVRDNLPKEPVQPEPIRGWTERLNKLLERLPPPMPPATGPIRGATIPLPPLDRRLLDLHNRVRADAGVEPLIWDPQLAAQANAYALTLAQHGEVVHASRQGRENSRENLLRAPRGMTPEQMIGRWAAERQNYVPGIFPNVSRTGNWADVAHYTQIVWSTTTRLGCGLQSGGEFNWLICRYSPPGNRDGRPVIAAKPRVCPDLVLLSGRRI